MSFMCGALLACPLVCVVRAAACRCLYTELMTHMGDHQNHLTPERLRIPYVVEGHI